MVRDKKIKALDTFYNGYLFRSRLEAKWAVFFDALGWRYEYENKDFNLPSGRYLPDFYFPEIGVYAEVKPACLSKNELRKCIELSNRINTTPQAFDVLLLEGPPDSKSYRTISEGLIYYEVVFLGEKDKFHPFYTEKFDKYYCDSTVNAIIESRMKRFEFESKTINIY